ncbi:TetR family transcriptional regulator [Mycobacterium vulneris]|uniref:TetR family transcriptional regulator n=1 Tax=Mycolicibacterium vulneris TaxID=547163 RepID=A0A1X2L3A8_9MYCO|nr:TetR/AcrR family transcriptional regulator [Mycolicibacterium vulneris]OSC28405.1 TetR family transcriptional regulator [Mycolicibacterium vulneris]
MPASLKGGGQLTRRTVIATAIALIESDGVDTLTMRKLARACGAAPMSLYRHVATKEELLHAVVDAYLADVELPSTDDLPWDEAIERVVLIVAAAFDAHPQLAEILAVQPIDAAAVLDAMERIARALRSAGFDDGAVRSGLATLSAFATGYAHRRAANRRAPDVRARRFGRLAEEPERFSALLSVSAGEGLDTPENFRAGLGCIIDALRREAPGPRRRVG